MVKIKPLLMFVAMASLVTSLFASEPPQPTKPKQEISSEEDAKKEENKQQRIEEFTPTEKISEDLSVSFPVDI